MRTRATARGFVGRTEELVRFRAAIERATSGQPAVLLVSGEAGVGKTRLVEQWLAVADAVGAARLVGHCVQLEHAAYPYAPVIEAIRALCRQRATSEVSELLGPGAAALATLLPELATHPAGQEPWGHGPLFEAVLRLLAGLAAGAEGGVVVAVVEDLHWADAATLDLLGYVIRNLADMPAVIVLTLRDTLGTNPLLQQWTAELRRLPPVDTVAITPFGRADTAALVSLRSGNAQPAATVEDVYRRSNGNAFHIEELLDASQRGEANVPSTLRDTVLGRVARLSADARRLLDVVAVGGSRVRVALIDAVVDGSPDAHADALAEAIDATVLVADGDSVGFRHAAFAEAIYDALLPAQRVVWHTRLAGAIAADPALAAAGAEAQLAAHWLAAGVGDQALSAAIGAARAAERQHAPSDALDQWDSARRLADTHPEALATAGLDEVELLAHMAEAANRAGRLDRAVELTREALDRLDGQSEPHRAGRLAERLGWYLTRRGDTSEALDAYQVALTLVPVRPSSPERARALTAMGRHLTREGKAADAVRWCEEAVSCAVAAGAGADEGFARHALGLALATEGRTTEAFEELVAAARIAETTGDVAELAWTCLHLEKVAVDASRLDEVVGLLLDRAAAASRRGRQRTYGGLLECIAAGALTELGRWDEADALANAVERRGPTGIERVAFDLVRGTLDVGRGHFERAEEALRAAQAVTIVLRDGRINGLVYNGLAELARWRDQLDAAFEVALEGLDAVADTGDDDMAARLCVTALRIEADRHERLGGRPVTDPARTSAIGRCLTLVRQLAAGEGGTTPSARVVAAAVEAEAEHARITGRADADAWHAAIEAAARLRSPYDEARARVSLAVVLAADGDRGGANEQLGRAHELATALGAAPLLDQIDGVTRRAHLQSHAAEPASGRATGDLTAREREVLRLIAAGRTNRQIATTLFISEKTASVHVSHILTKLDVASRGEAAAVAHRRGMAT